MSQEQEIIVSSLNDFIDFVEDLDYSYGSWIFRGESEADWELLPKIGRKHFDSLNYFTFQLAFNRWKDFASLYLNLPEDDWEQLAIAQHYGLSTRFLDWTRNPLVAIYFAVCDMNNSNGKLYALQINKVPCLPISGTKPIDLTEDRLQIEEARDWSNIYIYNPKPIDKRIINQESVFTYHLNIKADFNQLKPNSLGVGWDLQKIKIAGNCKEKIMDSLYRFGISAKSIFPDIEGITQQINFDLLHGKHRF